MASERISDVSEKQRIANLYEQLRLKLLDLSKKNRMLNYGLGAKSKRQVQIVDVEMNDVYKRLAEEEASLRIDPLAEPEDIPPEEKTENFIDALEHAKVSDIEYLTELEKLEVQGRDDEVALTNVERDLRHRVRAKLGLQPRPKRAEISRSEHARSLGIDPSLELQPQKERAPRIVQTLQTLKFPDELESILERISDNARLAEQEMGLSTLFLAFGFLEWYESDNSEKKAFAPLLLLPVRLETERIRAREKYYITAREGTAEGNLSLQKLLEHDFNRKLPDFESGDDEGIGSVDVYIDNVHAAIDGLKRWQVHRWLVLGHFAFGRFAMYADLNPENWGAQHPVEHPLVSSILRGTEDFRDAPLLPSVPEDYPIDNPEMEKFAPLLIQDADASQHSALIDVMRGKNLVIEGPPGTGKSQTITNIIANALAVDKKVLFLAEKQAALDVVKRRLSRSDIGDFCLELHSDKSSPKLVIESLKQRAELGWGSTKTGPLYADAVWDENRKEIAAYLNILHTQQPDGMTPHQLIWRALRGRSVNGDVIDAFGAVILPKDLLTNTAKAVEVKGHLELFAEISANFTETYGHHPAASPWAETDVENIRVAGLTDTLKKIKTVGSELSLFIAETIDFGIASVADIGRLVEINQALYAPPAPEIISRVATLNLDEFERALALIGEQHRLDGALSGRADLSREDPAKLAIATALLHVGLPSSLANKTPVDLYETADQTIIRNKSFVDLIDRFLPILQLFGFDRPLPAASLFPMAISVRASAKLMPEFRAWLNAHRDIDVPAFLVLHERWTRIVANEIMWRNRLGLYGNDPWPEATNLEAAATTLRQSGIMRLFSAITGAARTARELATRLGLGGPITSATALEQLAAHVRAVREFESDGTAARLLGKSWKGTSTPFDEIAAGIKFRELLLREIGGLSYGAEVAERLFSLTPNFLGLLSEADFVKTSLKFIDTWNENHTYFDDRSIARVIASCDEEVAVMRKVLATDPSRSLKDIALPIQEIDEIAGLTARRNSIARQIACTPVKDAAIELGRTTEGIALAVSAVQWIRAVRQTAPPSEIEAKLTSPNAIEERSNLRRIATQGAVLRDQHAKITSSLTNEFGVTGLDALAPEELVARAEVFLRGADELRDFLAIHYARKTLDDAGLNEFLARTDEIRLDAKRVSALFETILAARRANGVCSHSEMGRYRGATLDVRRRHFADRDRKKIEDDRGIVRTKLLRRLPLPGSHRGPRKSWTEMALLQNEFAKQKRFKPVRSLLALAGRSIQEMKPCFMMSPLSLAKFVGPHTLKFDLLVIDEASQMKPEEALGGMLRANQIVVVGDPKQLPPTDFFNRSNETTADEDFEDIDDESILEVCQKTFREIRRLKWHYRSRCESLIRFSNEEFYRKGLITFPAARPRSFSIDLVRVDGFYQARRNVVEASQIVEQAVKFMRHFAEMNEETIPTLGIVSVNIDQRDLIQEELRRRSADDSLVEKYREKVTKKGEPVFVKNLENVQGDERDFIFISMTYGREPGATVMKQRFGPINGKQGHRRLNVLFTRARNRIGLFTSFGSTDVKPAENSAEGVSVLKHYLEYAEGRGRAAIDSIGAEQGNDFEIEVSDRLRAKGYAVELQIGVSGYRIDLGVRHPDHLERFIAGVECDGAQYHSSKSARDRDRLREEVLQGLGWNIVRVWSTDWFDNPERETEKLVKRLEDLRSKPQPVHEDYPSLAAELGSQETEVMEEGKHAFDQEAVLNQTQEVVSDIEGAEIASQSDAISVPAVATADGDGPLTEAQGVQELVKFRESVIRAETPDWEAHRSILRDVMIETFIHQDFTDPEEWFTKVPTYLRQGTNPVEKNKYLESICKILSRIGTENVVNDLPHTAPKPLTPSIHGTRAPTDQYTVTDFAAAGLQPDASRFYGHRYRPTLRQMILVVINTEGPIYEDVLVDRIARAHGFQHSGSNIYQVVAGAIDRKFTQSKDDERVVIWPESVRTDMPSPFRRGSPDVRSHADIPIAELACLAIPFVRLRMSDEDVLRRMADHFRLGRLREATRSRFEAALKIARQSHP